MSFDQLVKDAQPAVVVAEAEGTEGRSWDFAVEVVDSNGDAVTLTGLTVQARVLSDIDGSPLVTFSPSVSGDDSNILTLTATPSDTASTASTGKLKRACPWHCTLTNGSGRKADLWGVQESRFIISQGG